MKAHVSIHKTEILLYVRYESATSFVPAEKSGNLVYHVSEKNDRNKIKIVQRADSISNATVSVRTLAEADTWKPVGTLGKTVNEFVLPNETVLLDVKIECQMLRSAL